jgi:hypothetical protein
VIAHNSKRDAENQPRVTIEQDGHSIAVAGSEVRHDHIIGKITELGVSQRTWLTKMLAF